MDVQLLNAMIIGCGDDRQERRNGSDRVGRKYSVLGDSLERGRFESRTWRPGMASAAKPCLVPTRLHVHDFLGVPDIRKLTIHLIDTGN